MTEIRFLIDLLLDNKLPKAVREKILARVGEVELGMSQLPPGVYPATQSLSQDQSIGIKPSSAQSPSTQRLMEKHNMQQPAQGPAVPVAAPVPVPRQVMQGDRAAVEVIGTMTPTGSSTRGPRKW